MPSGLQVFSDSFTLQIDSDFVNLALIRKGQVSTVTYNNGGWTISSYSTRAEVTLQPNEIIAFSCSSAPAALVSRFGNTAYLGVYGPAGTVINYWIFGPTSSQSTVGLQVFTPAGALAFDSSWKLFNVQGVAQGEIDPGNTPNRPGVTTQLPAGRQYAAVHLDIQAKIVYGTSYQGAQPAIYILRYRLTYISCAKILGAAITVSCTCVEEIAHVTQINSGIPIVDPYVEDNNFVMPRFLVIDVTDL